MMKARYPLLMLVSCLCLVLMMSIALNYRLFERAKQYYLELNATRLDPFGINYYPAVTNASLPQSDQRVVFFGDSRAEGWSAPTINGFTFMNRGIGSQTSVQVKYRFDAHVKPLHPQIVILQVGINDLKTIPLFPDQKELIIANCKENIRQLVTRSIAVGAKVILTTLFPLNNVPLERQLFWSDEVEAAIKEVNDYMRSSVGEIAVILDAYSILVNDNGRVKPDYGQNLLHLSETGYERLNVELIAVLKRLQYQETSETTSVTSGHTTPL